MGKLSFYSRIFTGIGRLVARDLSTFDFNVRWLPYFDNLFMKKEQTSTGKITNSLKQIFMCHNCIWHWHIGMRTQTQSQDTYTHARDKMWLRENKMINTICSNNIDPFNNFVITCWYIFIVTLVDINFFFFCELREVRENTWLKQMKCIKSILLYKRNKNKKNENFYRKKYVCYWITSKFLDLQKSNKNVNCQP